MPNGAAAPVVATGASGSAAGGHGHRENWRELAACRSAEPDLFFPAPAGGQGGVSAGGQSGVSTDGEAERAKAVCAECPVRRECLQFALATRQAYGIWGGMSEHERRIVQGRQPGPPPRARQDRPARQGRTA